MRTLISEIVTLVIVAGTGCGGGSGTDPNGLTTVEVTPTTASLFTLAPGNAVTLSVVGKDQDGQIMAGAGSASFSSDNGAVATVSNAGIVTAAAAGTARITASLTVGGVTKTAAATVTTQVAPALAGVNAPALAFLPGIVNVQAGGAVTWTMGSIVHNITFTSPGSPADIPDLQGGSDSRTFASGGTFAYHCTIHSQMLGTIYVH